MPSTVVARIGITEWSKLISIDLNFFFQKFLDPFDLFWLFLRNFQNFWKKENTRKIFKIQKSIDIN